MTQMLKPVNAHLNFSETPVQNYSIQDNIKYLCMDDTDVILDTSRKEEIITTQRLKG